MSRTQRLSCSQYRRVELDPAGPGPAEKTTARRQPAREHALLAPLAEALNGHYDQMSMDEIMARIERLSAERRQALFEWLGERVRVG